MFRASRHGDHVVGRAGVRDDDLVDETAYTQQTPSRGSGHYLFSSTRIRIAKANKNRQSSATLMTTESQSPGSFFGHPPPPPPSLSPIHPPRRPPGPRASLPNR
jgi:hypothetical protein